MAKRSRKKKENGRLVIRPSQFMAGGGLPEGELTVTAASFEWFDYGGKSNEVPALMLEFKDSDGEESDQAFSAGKAEDWQPTEDGEALEPAGDHMEGKTLNETCNAARLFSSLIEAGFDEDTLAEDGVGSMVGLTAVFKRHEVERKGLGEGKTFASLLIEEIVSMPGEEKKKTKRRGGKSKDKEEGTKRRGKKSRKTEDEEIEEHTEEMIKGLLENEKSGKIKKTNIVTLVHEVAEGEDDRDEMVSLSGDRDWLEHEDRPWASKGSKLVFVDEDDDDDD